MRTTIVEYRHTPQKQDMAGLIHVGAGKGMTAQGQAEFVEKNNFLHQFLGGGVNV